MSKNHHIDIGKFQIGNDLPFVLLAGPCAMESHDHAMDMAGQLCEMTQAIGINFIYKSSFDKANRSSLDTPRGIGLEKALAIFEAIRTRYNCPVVTDVHEVDQCAEVASVVDVLQIPAFLSRQTNLIVAAAKTGRVLNVKKGQFLAPWDMANIVHKAEQSGNPNIMLCERGASFGYNTLVTDFRGLPKMAETSKPVVFDATHSVQQPGGNGATSGGQREFVPVLARAAMAVGVAALFIETHQDPDHAPSDGPNMIPLAQLPDLLRLLKEIDHLAKANPIDLAK